MIGDRAPGSPPIDDMEQLVQFMRHHGVAVLLADTAREHLPAGLLVIDRGLVKSAVAAEMARRHELVTVLAAMQSRGLAPPLLIKGQALAYTLYQQPWLRPRTDIDALFEAGALDAVLAVLTALGYERVNGIDSDLILPQTSLLRHHCGVEHIWDVHWRISNRPTFANTLTIPDIRQRAMKIGLAGAPFLAPDRLDSLLLACLHLIGHHAYEIRLIWLYDIHLLVESLSASEKSGFLDKARSHPRVRAACHAALAVTQRYLPTERTDALCRALDPGSGARWKLERTYLASLMDDARAVGPGHRLRLLAQHVFPSRQYMLRRFPIQHRWQLPFWYGLRLARALPKLMRRR